MDCLLRSLAPLRETFREGCRSPSRHNEHPERGGACQFMQQLSKKSEAQIADSALLDRQAEDVASMQKEPREAPADFGGLPRSPPGRENPFGVRRRLDRRDRATT